VAKQKISDLQEGTPVATYMQLEEGQLFNFKNKQGKYALFTFSDSSGSIRGVCWDKGEKYHSEISDGAIIYVVGKTVMFNNFLQINVESIEPAGDEDYDAEDFILKTGRDIDQMFDYLLEIIDSVKNEYLGKLLNSVFRDGDFAETFKEAPAAKTLHHNYVGGLLEHTTNCLRLADTLCGIYPQLDRDLLISGTMIHDIGKTVEMSFDKKVDYTDMGRLLGHIVLGQTMILDKIRAIDGFPEDLKNEMLHLIVSHHGENATGSPKRPKTAEACALHFLENLDAQTKRFLQIIDENSKLRKDARWTSYDRLLERYLYQRPSDEEQ